MSIAVLGAGGTIAPAIVRDLAQSDEVESMLLLDLDQERASSVAAEHGAGKAVARAVDAGDASAMAAALDGMGAIINSASYRINLEAMRASLEAGCHYLDLGGLYWMTQKQLEFGPEFERAGLVAVLGIGSSPGKTNLMAARGARELGGEDAERIEVFAAGRDQGAPDDGRLRPPYSLQTLIDELTLSPVVLRSGNPVEIEPLTAAEAEDFGEPIGVAETIYTLHSELATFGDSFGCREASFRLSLSPALLQRLEELASAGDDERAAATRDAARPSDQTVSVHLVRLTGSAGRVVSVRAVTQPWSGLGGSIVSTAAPAAAAVRLLARGSVTATGVLPPERCLDPDEMFAELEQQGCSFSVALG
jgi:saccharopine dehydrogenase (NAD+, L-lysine-forming)